MQIPYGNPETADFSEGFELAGDRTGNRSPASVSKQRPDASLILTNYYGIWAAIHRAKTTAGLDREIQTCHGFRKYFENALDGANIDHEKKMMIEGHFAGTRAKH